MRGIEFIRLGSDETDGVHGATTFTSLSEPGSSVCIALQGRIEKRDDLSDYRFGSLFRQKMTASYVESSDVVRPTAPDIGRCQRAGFHPTGNKPFIRPEHHYGTSNLVSRCPVSRIMINIDVICGPIILDHRTAHRSLTKRLAISVHRGRVQLLHPTGYMVQRGIKKGIGIGSQHALRQIAWLGEEKPVKGSLGKLPVDGGPNIKRRHDGERTISAHTVRMVECEPITDARSPIMPYDGKALVSERAHHCDEFRADCSLMPRPGVQNAAFPVAWQIGRNNGVALR